jgi:hypothetical protein
MDPVVGIFSSSKSAHEAAHRLHGAGFSKDRISLLLPGAASPTPRTLEAQVPTDDAEQPGVGQAIGGVVGATAGASAGFGAGALVASLLVPGVGAVTAIGLAAAALLGAAGAVGGVKAGEALENTRQGIPKDELYLYEDALAHGYAVVFAEPRDDAEARAAREILLSSGAQSLEAAREAWWVGIRDTEKAHFDARHGDFESAEDVYRAGLLGGLAPQTRGRSFEEALPVLRRRFGSMVDHAAFRQGFARGQQRARERQENLEPARQDV